MKPETPPLTHSQWPMPLTANTEIFCPEECSQGEKEPCIFHYRKVFTALSLCP